MMRARKAGLAGNVGFVSYSQPTELMARGRWVATDYFHELVIAFLMGCTQVLQIELPDLQEVYHRHLSLATKISFMVYAIISFEGGS